MSRVLALALSAMVLAVSAPAGFAAERRAKPIVVSAPGLDQAGARHYRSRPTSVRHHAGRRIGFYSYGYRDVINTYGMSRSLYGSINSYRNPHVDRQTPAGPFDHGFFFDPGIMPRGGYSPYMN